jgi:hypothetical protein
VRSGDLKEFCENQASANFEFLISYNPVRKQAVKNFHVPRPARKQSLRKPRFAGECRLWRHAGRVLPRDREKLAGFSIGSVENQQQ